MRAQVPVQELGHVRQRDLPVQERLADAAEEYEGQGAGVHLLVVQHVVGQRAAGAVEAERGDLRRQAGGVDRGGDAGRSASTRLG